MNTVLVVSIDALHPDALLRAKTSNLQRLMREGAFTLSGRSTDPPKTLIAHTAMFTGLSPELNGKTDNAWAPGEPTVSVPTIFDDARQHGFQTGYFFSKEKLGYLVNGAVEQYKLSAEYAIDAAYEFLQIPGRHFVFLHISGLDQIGPVSGWLSADYLEELFFIDEYLSSVVDLVKSKGRYLLVVTSDHAGHGRIHGSQHPDDYRLPLIAASDIISVKQIQDMQFSVVALKTLLANWMSVSGDQ